MEKKYKDYFEVNRETWNKKVEIHKDSNFYDVLGFKKGNTSLNSYELEALGNVKDKKLLHLQCHFGLDTLSWSRLGALCTGIDLSDAGIHVARDLNKELGLNAKFVVSNVYDVPKKIPELFDIVFTSYGVIGWLPDLNKWATVIADKLEVGGCFYMVEFHPIVWMFDYLEQPAVMKYAYHKGDVIYEEYEGTYTDEKATITSKEYGWNHGLGEVVTALSNAGLEIEFLNELDESPYDCLPQMKKLKNGRYVLEQNEKLFPLLYEIKAIKK